MLEIGGGEALTIVLPHRTADRITATAFVPSDDEPLYVQCGRATLAALSRTNDMERYEWVAIAAPGYGRTDVDGTDIPHGELERDYLNGDEAVYEVLLVVVLDAHTNEIEGQMFRQPLLIPDGEPGLLNGGPVGAAARTVLHVANSRQVSE
jgi:hypothetical protein